MKAPGRDHLLGVGWGVALAGALLLVVTGLARPETRRAPRPAAPASASVAAPVAVHTGHGAGVAPHAPGTGTGMDRP